jgi:hypothetical protein
MRGARQPQTSPIQVLDVGRDPQIKNALLSGRIQGLTAPFMYHDPSKQLALVLMPMEMNLRDTDQQRIIGQMTQAVMRNLPENAPRGYLLQPKTFFTFQSLIEEILQADGVSPETIRAQEEKANLLRELARINDPQLLRERVRENDAKIDGAFFDIFAATLDANVSAGRESNVRALDALQKIIIEETTYGKGIGARMTLVENFRKSPTREVLLEQLIGAADKESREILITLGRQLLDYAFFQQLTSKVDAVVDQAEKDKLIALRKEVQDVRDKVDAAQKAYIQEKSQLIQTIASSKDPLQTARQNADLIDDAFFQILQMNAQAAQQRNDENSLKALEAINDIAMQIMAEKQPPEVQMVNALLAADYPDETKKMLEELKDVADDRIIGVMSQFADQLAQQDRTDLSAKMTKIMVQARGILPKYSPANDAEAQAHSGANEPPPPPQSPKPLIEIARR